jgi:hypothetical protein
MKRNNTLVTPTEDIEKIDETSEIIEPFNPTKIDITQKVLTIDLLVKRLQNGRIDLYTEFQRGGNLWSISDQSRLIESLLVRIPLPAFYFDGTDDNRWKVVDGLQRLYTLNNFIVEKTLKLTNLEFLKDQYEGFGFAQLPTFLQARIEETNITAFIINPGTPPEVKFNIFKRINTGGIVLTPQEIRHALNQGIPADFVKELAKLPEFRKATTNTLSNAKRMEDRDFVTRFIAFHLLLNDYRPDLDSFLNNAMSRLKDLSDEERSKVKEDFQKAMSAAYLIFGNDAFRKRYKKEDGRKPLNKALFEAWSVNLAKLNKLEIDCLVQKKELIKDEFMTLMNDNNFNRAISASTGDMRAVDRRFSNIREIIEKILNAHTG